MKYEVSNRKYIKSNRYTVVLLGKSVCVLFFGCGLMKKPMPAAASLIK